MTYYQSRRKIWLVRVVPRQGNKDLLRTTAFTTSDKRNILTSVTGKKEKLPLSVTHPELAKEADGWDPAKLIEKKNTKVNWKCRLNHLYSSTITDRVERNRGCPFCAGQKVLPGFNDFASAYSEIAKEAYGWDPTKVTRKSSKKMPWRCTLGHVYEAVVYSRVRGDGCPVCSGRQVLAGFNDLSTTHPEIAAQADGWDPSTVSKGSNKAQLWKCNSGHSWEVSTNKRTSEKSGCPVCSNHQILVGVNDLATSHPDIAKQMIESDPTHFVGGSEKKVKWKCEKGHIYQSSISNRTSGSGCSICTGKQVLSGFNDLASAFPEVAREAFGWDPTKVAIFSQKKMKWKCSRDHIFIRQVSNRTTRENRCPICTGHQVLAGFNDLQTTHPAIAQESVGWDPQEVTAGSGKKVEWMCASGHRFKAQVANRTIRGDKCPICSGKQVLQGFNDLATTHPELSAQLVEPLQALKISSGSDKKLKWQCEKGHRWITSVSNRKAGNGCPSCVESGFNPNLDAYLYFLEHERWSTFQIGITNYPDDRLRVHKNRGWSLLELRGPMDGHLTQQWETAILRMLKAKGADLSNSKIAGKFDGYSEAWSKSTFEVKSIKELMKMTEEFEEKSE